MDTIFALASARGKAGVSVFRVSGPRARAAAERLTGGDLPAQRPVLRRIARENGDPIDRGLVIVFPRAQSYTGEEVVEFQLHGSPAVAAALLGALSDMDGLRIAEPGEFTRRALENGRLDLTQVEGLADLIESETELQRKLALRVTDGALQRASASWREALVRAAALLAASIDFADEDIPDDVSSEVLALLEKLACELRNEIEGSRAAERIRDGFEVAIVGRPNSGKSTLLNALAGRDAAITSDVEGTTRDVIEVRMDLQGLPVTILDTAGMRETDDRVERIGVDRARQRAKAADLRVFLVAEHEQAAMEPEPEDLVVIAKGDLYSGSRMSVSGKTGAGIRELTEAIVERLSVRVSVSATATRARHRQSISEALGYIEAAQANIVAGESRIEFAGEDLQRAIRSLDILVGRVDVEQILDVIFASFCLGK